MRLPNFSGRIALAIAALAIFSVVNAEDAAPRRSGGSITDPRAAGMAARMEKWRNLRFGLFIHWGPYSELGGIWQGKVQGGNTEWLMHSAKISRADYRQVAKDFDPEAYDPDGLVTFAKRCGFNYIVMTAKHYDGFALFDSQVSDFDSVDVLPSKRDLLKEFSVACKKGGMPLGFSYAVDRDWYHPGGNTLGPAWDPTQAGSRYDYLEKIALPQLRELLDGYGPALTLLADSGPGIPSRLVPAFQEALGTGVAMATDFAGRTDYRYTDGLPLQSTVALLDWEKCTCLGNSWGYRKGKMNYQPVETILRELIATNSTGGNYLLNVGLDGEGRIPAEAEERLEAIGSWLSKYGESIDGTSRSPFVRHSWKGGATVKDEGEDGATLYLHLFGKEKREKIALESLLTEPQLVEVMGTGEFLNISGAPGAWVIDSSVWEPREEISVLRVKLTSMPKLGEGPITAGPDGRFQLALARGRYTDHRATLGRTASSAALQFTGFSDERDVGNWELRSAKAVPVRLGLQITGPLPAEGKELVLSVDGKKVGEAKILPPEDAAKPAVVESPSFEVPVGNCRIGISGKESPANSAPISVSKIELIPAP